MPHGGYHGVVKVGNTIVQQGSPAGAPPGQGGQYNPDGYATEMAGSSAPSTTESIEKQIEDKKKQIELLNVAQSGFGANAPGMGFPMSGQEGKLKFKIDSKTGLPVPGEEILGSFPFNIPDQGFVGDTAKGLATLQNIQNQQLNNLLKLQQEKELRDTIIAQATGANLDPVDIEQGLISPFLRKSDFTGDAGDKTFLGINLGSTPTVAATTTNPYTGEKITTTKAREGLSSEDYAKFMAGLYDANPALMEQTFPVASGNLAQPILARLLEGGLGGVGSGIGSFIDSATGAIFKPRGGTVRPSDVGTPSDTGGVTSVIDAPKANNNPFNIPSAFTGFYESDFYNPNAAGGQMITSVTLPDGTVVRFPNTAIGGQFRQYLESLGMSQPPATGIDVVDRAPQPTGISKFDVDKFYASLPQYTQQGIMAPANLSRFTDALKMFPGMA